MSINIYKYRIADAEKGVMLHLRAKSKEAALEALENLVKEIKEEEE